MINDIFLIKYNILFAFSETLCYAFCKWKLNGGIASGPELFKKNVYMLR